jgi:hypothetical protein
VSSDRKKKAERIEVKKDGRKRETGRDGFGQKGYESIPSLVVPHGTGETNNERVPSLVVLRH